MANVQQMNLLALVINVVDDAIVADPKAPTLRTAEFQAAVGTRLIAERANGDNDARNRFVGKFAEFFSADDLNASA